MSTLGLRRWVGTEPKVKTTSLDSLKGAKVILCASTGGHLQQLHRLASKLSLESESTWITFDTPQSRSLLAGRNVEYVPYIASRDFMGALRILPRAVSLLKSQSDTRAIISTGSAIAGVFLPVAQMFGKEAIYIESVARFDGPSLTGRMLRTLPKTRLFTQHPAWEDSRWKYEMSILDEYRSFPSGGPSKAIENIFVTLGTIDPFRFDSLVDRILTVIPRTSNIVWQIGSTNRSDLPGKVVKSVPVEKFDDYVRESDVVITHAGVGSALRILDLGKSPVMVPRRAYRNEHIDDHQLQISQRLSELDLVVECDAAELAISHLELAASKSIKNAGSNQLGEVQ